MTQPTKQSGFTAVELLITLFVAAAFLIAAYQLFNLVIKDGGNTRAESRASNVAYDYMRQYAASSTTIPCTPSTPLSSVPVSVDGLSDATITVTVTCLPNAISSLSKVEVALSYNKPLQTVKYSTFVSSSGSTSTGDITNGLAAWYKLNGDPNNSIGSVNGAVSNAVPGTHNGIPNLAYSFNGTNASIIANSNFGLGATNATISCWVYNANASNSGLFVKVGNGYGIGIGSTTFDNTNPGTKLIMIYGGIRWIVTGTDLGTGWHHVVMVVDGSGVPTAYLDGVSAGSYPGASPAAPTQITYIGGGDGSTRWFKGSVDDVRLYNRALPLSDILSLYSAGAK